LLQYTPKIGDKKANLKKIEALLSDAVEKINQGEGKLSLVVCPELSLTGPVHSLGMKEIHCLGESVEGETVNNMKEFTMKYQTSLAFGMIESEGDHLYSTVFLLAPNGKIAAKARKIHLTESDERWATPGEDIVVTYIEGLDRVGLMAGYDAAFPEMAGVMAVKRADTIIIPSSWHGEFGATLSLHKEMMENRFPVNSMTTWDAIARFSQANTLVANFVGTNLGCKGGSALYTLDPIYGGRIPVVASSDKEEALVVTLPQKQTDWWFDQQKLLLSRKTHFYRPLIKN
ncbi:MAG TPA: carbon-nitrogen hydrolase family protein, partial [Chondromyces sp.]|nr:carbon-nitrogen hydrolase family protein [Chondromyces sp.]